MRAIAPILVTACLLAGASPAAAGAPAVFTVDTSTDDKGSCGFDGNCSLYEAISAANSTPNDPAGPDVIEFAIPGGGPHTIQPATGFPNLSDPVVIDGWSQGGVGYTGPPLIVLDGQGTAPSGLWVTNPAAGSTIRGLSIVNSSQSGIQLGTGTPGDLGGSTLHGNYIGVMPDGTTSAGNASRGVWINNSPDNVVGGAGPGQGNVISDNQTGVLVIGAAATGNLVRHSMIGTTADGSAALGNADAGVLVQQASDNVVGPGNVISGNLRGVELAISGGGNEVVGNRIGTDAAGTSAIGNTLVGLQISSPGNTIGRPGQGNLISGNGGHGVSTSSDATVIQGNVIGTDASGGDLGNGASGVHVFAGAIDVVVGGSGPGEGNTVAFNGTTAIHPGVDLRSAGTENVVLGNSIHDNGGLGIDLGATGVTGNDSPDTDGFPNFPMLSWAISGSTSMAGRLAAEPATSYRIEIFSSPAADPSGNGEGQAFLGAVEASTDGSGEAGFLTRLDGDVADGDSLTMTATKVDGMALPLSTSEFSEAVPFPTSCDLVGTPARDVLKGTASDEVLCGEGGNDVLVPAGGFDAVLGGPGRDMIRFSDGPVDVDLFHEASTDGSGAVQLLLGLERVAGTSEADVLRGDGRANVLKGKGGADLLVGRGRKDVLAGGGGPDRIRGGPGNDVLRGQRGGDNLDGGPGRRDRCRQGPGKGKVRRCER